jgi:hypothetical protein
MIFFLNFWLIFVASILHDKNLMEEFPTVDWLNIPDNITNEQIRVLEVP